MKKFINQLKNEINNFKFGPISAELKDLTIIKYVLVKLSKICSRDDRFFLYKENLTLRRKLYNKKLTYNKNEIKISCKSFCSLVQEILNNLKIKTILFSPGEDEFRHYVLIYLGQTKNYYIDPLHDLVNFKVYDESQFFCSEYEKYPNISVLSKNENKCINSIIGYKPEYHNRIQQIKVNKHKNILEIMLSIIKDSKCYSVSDLIIYLNKIIADILNELKEDIEISYCLALKKIKKYQNQKNINKNELGVYISYNNQDLYIFPSSNNIFMNLSEDLRNLIYVKLKIRLKTFQKFKNLKVNRQILDNIYFQKVFSEIESREEILEKDISIDEHGNIYLINHEMRFSIYKNNHLLIQTKNIKEYIKVNDFGRKVLIKRKTIKI